MLRFGIVGTNFISDWFTEACGKTDGMVTPVAVYSRSEERGQQFAESNSIPLVFTDLSQMIDEVDAVYVASPTSAHFPQALEAIRAGKHVLVEKTMTENAARTEELFTAAEAEGVVAMEAMRSLHAPAHTVVKDALPDLGTLRYAHLEMMQYSSRYDRHKSGEHMNAFDPSLGNSALADIGVYCLEAALDWFGIPESQSGDSVRLENGFEALGSIQLTYPGMLVDVVYSKVVQSVVPSVIAGEDGSLTIDNMAQPGRIVLERRGEPEVLLFEAESPEPADSMHFEVLSFARQVQEGAMDPRWRKVTAAARQIMDKHLE